MAAVVRAGSRSLSLQRPWGKELGGLYVLQEAKSRSDPPDMTNNDEPIYETIKRECNWDPERCEPLGLTTLSGGRHRG